MVSSAIIDCLASVGHNIPNVECIVNLIHQILEPGIAELFKMHVHLISSSFKVKKMFQIQSPNQLVSSAMLPKTFTKFHGFDITNKRHCTIHAEFGKNKIGKYQLGWLHFVLTNVLADLDNIKFSVRCLSLYWQNAAMMHGLSRDIIIICLCHKMI